MSFVQIHLGDYISLLFLHHFKRLIRFDRMKILTGIRPVLFAPALSSYVHIAASTWNLSSEPVGI
jgi:hypothetical protein